MEQSVVSPTLFSIMINDIFVNVPVDMGRSLMMGLYGRGRNVRHKIQDGIRRVEERGMKWGSKFSVEKNKLMLFTKKRLREDGAVKLYGRNLERVESF